MLPCNLVPAVQVAINNSTHLHTTKHLVLLKNVQQHFRKLIEKDYHCQISKRNFNKDNYKTYCIKEDKNIEEKEESSRETCSHAF